MQAIELVDNQVVEVQAVSPTLSRPVMSTVFMPFPNTVNPNPTESPIAEGLMEDMYDSCPLA